MNSPNDLLARRTPRPPSSLQVWFAPPRNLDWIAARIGHGGR